MSFLDELKKLTHPYEDEDEEFEVLQREANILSGKEHSNVLSMTLNDYRVAPGVVFMTRSDPQLTFSNRSLRLNGVCRQKLGEQKYVDIDYAKWYSGNSRSPEEEEICCNFNKVVTELSFI